MFVPAGEKRGFKRGVRLFAKSALLHENSGITVLRNGSRVRRSKGQSPLAVTDVELGKSRGTLLAGNSNRLRLTEKRGNKDGQNKQRDNRSHTGY